jgi:hypothetical protein
LCGRLCPGAFVATPRLVLSCLPAGPGVTGAGLGSPRHRVAEPVAQDAPEVVPGVVVASVVRSGRLSHGGQHNEGAGGADHPRG